MTVSDRDREALYAEMAADLEGCPFDAPSAADLEMMFMAALLSESRLIALRALLAGYRELHQTASLRGWSDPDPAATREMLADVEALHADLAGHFRQAEAGGDAHPTGEFDQSQLPF